MVVDLRLGYPRPMPTDVFSEGEIGPITLRNRFIRSAAFEGMCPGGVPSGALIEYHRSVAAGGIGMTTVAYVSVARDGRSFSHQAWMRPEILGPLGELCDAVHREGALASVQLGHCGNMSDRRVSGVRPIAPSAVFNLFGLTYPRAMTPTDIEGVAEGFAASARLAMEAGFDAVEIHAGHGYLISQFLSPRTNRRKDEFGGDLENRCRFGRMVVERVSEAVGGKLAVLVKMNLSDGFAGGAGPEEAAEVAKVFEAAGAHALILSGGFVSKTPMYVMRGDTPLAGFTRGERRLLAKVGLALFGRVVVKTYPFEEAYFLDEARVVREAVGLPLVLVGGLVSRASIERAMSAGFDFAALARPLIAQPDFVDRLRRGELEVSPCDQCNTCVASMYHDEARCHLAEGEGPETGPTS